MTHWYFEIDYKSNSAWNWAMVWTQWDWLDPKRGSFKLRFSCCRGKLRPLEPIWLEYKSAGSRWEVWNSWFLSHTCCREIAGSGGKLRLKREDSIEAVEHWWFCRGDLSIEGFEEVRTRKLLRNVQETEACINGAWGSGILGILHAERDNSSRSRIIHPHFERKSRWKGHTGVKWGTSSTKHRELEQI